VTGGGTALSAAAAAAAAAATGTTLTAKGNPTTASVELSLADVLPDIHDTGTTATTAASNTSVATVKDAATRSSSNSSLHANYPDRRPVNPVDQAANEEGNDDRAAATTLILRNLPSNFDQPSTEAWVNEKGYADLYDFLLWFPAQATSRSNRSGVALHL